ncbi:XRE family plasmid maintenance system antidote protein [Flavobacterium enshiense DK69]|uniref:XRE family transcriptional regulator n=1 Tax=Flavobacterium enshiense DK69 TaxID=1107311 RepID=V6SCM0_9FLAO|nr:HigA family addiction module antitoxin [Flavobacterium enshiense]ESU24361.1 XRE family plasmid maintenance system antidote protein [Flavobacterium enshiense DK69]KGO94467.1 XRE family transcriptional regulator [Flavobacterium enshiense DK69]
MAPKTNQYIPQTVSHPGKTLGAKLEELKMGSKEFAVRTGKPEKTISNVLSGESAITSDMAVLFEDVLGIPAHFWLNRQNQYDEAVARLKREESIHLSLEWAKHFPYAEMAKLGWVAATSKLEEKVENLFKFFRLSSQEAFDNYYFKQKLKVNFRLTLAHEKKPYAVAAWLRQGEIQASELEAQPYDEKILLSKLPEIKSLMAKHPEGFFKNLQSICLEAGVKVVYTPCLKGAALHGSTRWLSDTPLVQMSARYAKNDIFWFTFFHELAHIIMHGKKHIALENKVDYDAESKVEEQEADDFAIKWTFSKEEEQEVLRHRPLKESDILRFAKQFNTHPAMIIGRFHHKKLLPFSLGNQFIEKIEIDN